MCERIKVETPGGEMVELKVKEIDGVVMNGEKRFVVMPWGEVEVTQGGALKVLRVMMELDVPEETGRGKEDE